MVPSMLKEEGCVRHATINIKLLSFLSWIWIDHVDVFLLDCCLKATRCRAQVQCLKSKGHYINARM